MPRDSRLYMTFPIDFWTHPKVSRLSDAAFRAFVEANGHSRMREVDGVLEADDAEFLWKPEALTELVHSHPSRPLMFRDDDGNYVLRDYAEHQFTKADRDELTEKRRLAGIASANKRSARAQHVLNTDQQTATEIGKEKGTSTSNEVEEPRKRAHSIPDNFTITERMRAWAADNAPLVDLDAKLPEFIDYWRGVGKPMKDWEAVWHNGMRKQQTFAERDRTGPRQAKADVNAAEYHRLYGGTDERAGSVPALDPGVR